MHIASFISAPKLARPHSGLPACWPPLSVVGIGEVFRNAED
jgi:hypothetical protein